MIRSAGKVALSSSAEAGLEKAKDKRLEQVPVDEGCEESLVL